MVNNFLEPNQLSSSQKDLLEDLQKKSFKYFIDQQNPETGLVADSTWKNSPSSIAAVGFSLPVYAVGVQHGWLPRSEAVDRSLAVLKFFAQDLTAKDPTELSYQGFYYHFLDMNSGKRVGNCEISTIDSAILIAGMLAAGAFFQEDRPGEVEIGRLANELYRRVNWQWALDGGKSVSHGWKPESGFLPYQWQGYDEALLLYILGLGSPTYPLPASSYQAWTSTFQWITSYGIPYLFAGPLFIHHFSHIWIDFRGIEDPFTREHQIDYFENSRRAAYIHQQYCIENPKGFTGYGKNFWGITASEGPVMGAGPVEIEGRTYYGYQARGVPGPDDGTLSPWTVITSLPFASEIAVPSIEQYLNTYPRLFGSYGMMCSLNLTVPSKTGEPGPWYSNNYYGINEGPVVLMIENYLRSFVWKTMKPIPFLRTGLKRAGFSRRLA